MLNGEMQICQPSPWRSQQPPNLLSRFKCAFNLAPLLYHILSCAVGMEGVDSIPPVQVGLLLDGSRRET